MAIQLPRDQRDMALQQIGQNLGSGIGRVAQGNFLQGVGDQLQQSGASAEDVYKKLSTLDPEYAQKTYETQILKQAKLDEENLVQSLGAEMGLPNLDQLKDFKGLLATQQAIKFGQARDAEQQQEEALKQFITMVENDPEIMARVQAELSGLGTEVLPTSPKAPTPNHKVVVDPSSPTGYSFQDVRNPTDPLIPNAPAPGSGVTVNVGNKPASATERSDIADVRTTLDSLDNLEDLFEPDFVGIVAGRAGKVKDVVGGNPQKQSEFNAATAALKNSIIKQITGAQMSEPEAKRIMKQIPDVTNPPSVWKARLNQSILNSRMMERRRLQVLRQSGLRVPENTTDLSTLSDEDLFGGSN